MDYLEHAMDPFRHPQLFHRKSLSDIGDWPMRSNMQVTGTSSPRTPWLDLEEVEPINITDSDSSFAVMLQWHEANITQWAS